MKNKPSKPGITREQIEELVSGKSKQVLIFEFGKLKIYIAKSYKSTLVLKGSMYDGFIKIESDSTIPLHGDIDTIMKTFQKDFEVLLAYCYMHIKMYLKALCSLDEWPNEKKE